MRIQKSSKTITIPVLIFKHRRFAGMLNKLVKQFGSAGLSMVYSMGQYLGKEDVKELHKTINSSSRNYSKLELFEKVLDNMKRTGCGFYIITKFDTVEGEIMISSKNNPFSKICENPSSEGCYFLRGYLSSIASEITEFNMICNKQQCMHSGAERCTFSITRTQ